MALLNTIAKDAVKYLGTGVQGAVYNGVTNGNWTDITPGYGAKNVITTQFANATAPSKTVPTYNTQAVPQAQVQSDSSTTNNSGQYDPAADAAAKQTAANNAQYDLAISQYEGQLGRLPGQLGIAQGNINTQYGQKANELQSGYNQAQNTYGQNTQQNGSQYIANKNQVRDTASAGLRGLLRTLGAYGAGGGTDQQYGTGLVAQTAAKQASGAGETYGQNQQGLDTSWGNYGNQFNGEKQKLEDWKQSQLQTADQTSTSSKQSILQTLANLRAQRAGGNTAAATAAMNEANGLQSRIDQLGVMNPTYTGNTPVYNAPDVASYTVDPNAQTQVNADAQDSLTAPWLAALLGKDKKQATYA